MGQVTVNGEQDYEVLKMELKATLDETADNFIIIGHILKQVRDRSLYLHGNYRDIYDFGMREYGLSRATVSRFMNINTKFSIGGNSREIRPEYKGYGRSKIQEMLNVDEGDMGLVTADTTVDQVKELKKAEEEQRRIEKEEQANNLPLIRMSAENGKDGAAPGPGPESMEPFDAVMTAFWKENIELYRKVAAGLITPEIAAEEISPSGSRTYRNGVNMMFFYDFDKGAKLRSYAHGKADITPYTYQDLMEKTRGLDPGRVHEGGGKTPDPAENVEPPEEKTVATPQPGAEDEGQADTYTPVPGQTSLSVLQGILPGDDDAVPGKGDDTEDRNPDGNAGKVIDVEYRELDGGNGQDRQQTLTDVPYSDDEIRKVIEYFDTEYERMTVLHMDGLKRLACKVARECIRKSYGSIADQIDGSLPGTGG